jgi:hypothetical protein
MPRFVHFDPAAPAGPVLGWYDTDELHYPNPPPEEARIAVSDAVWDRRMDSAWRVEAGQLVEVAPPTEADVAEGMARAQRNVALAGCDWAALPDAPLTDAQRAAWLAYRRALREWPAQAGWPDLPLPTPPG